MSAVIELEDKKTEVSSNGNNEIGILKPYLFTVKIYDEMIKKGILDENDNVELLNGRIVKKMPKGTKHSLYNDIISDVLKEKVKDVYVRNQNPIWLSEISEPEPDLVLAKLPRDKYVENHPTSEDILLLIEISDSTLSLDKNAKSKMYASAGIVQYLVVDVGSKLVIDYREPFEDDYQTKQTYRIGDNFNLVKFPDVEISVEEFFNS